MSKSGREEPIHFSLTEKTVKVISTDGSKLISNHFQEKTGLEGCVEISVEPPPLMLFFDTPEAAQNACWLLESLARLDEGHREREIQLLIQMKS